LKVLGIVCREQTLSFHSGEVERREALSIPGA